MTTFTLTVQLTKAARDQLAKGTETICITRNASGQDASTPRPVWVSFYKDSPYGINPTNTITWEESWELNYATEVFSDEGTQIVGSGTPSTDPDEIGFPSPNGTGLTLNTSGDWQKADGKPNKDFTVNNNHGSEVTFIYYTKTSVNNKSGGSTGNPIYTSSQFIQTGGLETVVLQRSVNFLYRGKGVNTGTVVAESGSQHPTVITLNGTKTSVSVDYSPTRGWDFGLAVPSVKALGRGHLAVSGTDLVTAVNVSKALANELITGSITVKEAILAGVAFFIVSGVRINVTGSSEGGTKFRFSYTGPLSSDGLIGTFLNHVATWYSASFETLEERRQRLRLGSEESY